MGFFTDLFAHHTQPSVLFGSEQEAFLAILLAVASADGIYTEEDYQLVAGMLSSNPFFFECNLPVLREKLQQKAALAGSLEQLIPAAVLQLNPIQRKSVFVYAMDIILNDGIVTADEDHIMEEIRNGLGISDSFAQATFEVIVAKNQA
jgi:uncharacterized tellurite resistance protein B-like protein